MIRFDSKALYQALAERRTSLGMSWKQVADEIGVSAATLMRTRQGGRMEVDGILAMVGWLGRTVESFTREARR
jgi:transcriptional regulator with XRE-family HTH domain